MKSQGFKSLEYKISKVSNKMRSYKLHSNERQNQNLAKELKTLRKERFQTVGLKNKVIRIKYIHYADDWMIGISGDRKLAFNIKEKVTTFMINSLKQELHPIKTKITNLRKGNVQFLGYLIFLPLNRPI